MTSGKMTVRELIIDTTKKFQDAKIESASIDCRLILCKYLNVDKVYLIVNSEKEISPGEDFYDMVKRRINREPMQYILGKCEFMGMEFSVSPSVLIPRPDTEILVETVISFIGEQSMNFLDIGTGSGCIPVSILNFCKNASGKTIDISKDAIDTAKKNAEKHNVSERLAFLNKDILSYFPKEKFDVIVSNPPYIRTDVLNTLMPEVQNFEPKIALCGGTDGLMFYKRIAKEGFSSLKDGGLIAFEIGYDQAEDVKNLLLYEGFSEISVTKDLSGNDRVVMGIKIR